MTELTRAMAAGQVGTLIMLAQPVYDAPAISTSPARSDRQDLAALARLPQREPRRGGLAPCARALPRGRGDVRTWDGTISVAQR